MRLGTRMVIGIVECDVTHKRQHVRYAQTRERRVFIPPRPAHHYTPNERVRTRC